MKVSKTMKMTSIEDVGAANRGLQRQNSRFSLADFETAIGLTGYGKYNIALFFATMFGILACQFDTSVISFIIPSAGCDLELTDNQKGWINASIYCGMVLSATIWSIFLDTLRRRKIIICGFFLDGLVNLASTFSPNFYTLFFFKFLSGVIICGPNAVMLAFLAENHSAQVRARVMMFVGIFYSLGTLLAPVLALYIIPQESLNFSLWGYEIRSWRIFLIVCSSFGIMASIAFLPFYESPKFLMTSGRNEEALRTFKQIYTINIGKPNETYPVKSLFDEMPDQIGPHHHIGFIERIRMGCHQIVLLFSGNFLKLTLLNFGLQFGSMFSQNTLRLWIPQLFATIEDFYGTVSDTEFNNTAFTICEMIDGLKLKEMDNVSTIMNSTMLECGVGALSPNTYINSIIMGMMGICGYLLAGYFVNKTGKKNILTATFIIASICSLVIYWTTDMILNLALLAIFISSLGINATSMISITVDLYPTTMRAMAVSLTLMAGRGGTVLGNILFPVLVDLGGCICPFFLVSALTGVSTFLTFGVPRTLGKALE